MKNLLAILVVLFVGLNAFGQRDTTNLFWENGIKKYEHICCYIDTIYVIRSSDDKKTPQVTEYIEEYFWNKDGLEIEELDFIRLYGSEDINEVRKTISNKKNISCHTDYLVNRYNKHIKEADNYFFEKNYTKSIEYYKLALDILPNEEYPKIQLKKLRNIK